MGHIYIMEYYSAIKRNESGSFVEMWMGLESIIQSEANVVYQCTHVESTKMVQMNLLAGQE